MSDEIAKVKFEIVGMADVSTGHITHADAMLLDSKAPYWLTDIEEEPEMERGSGDVVADIMYVPLGSCTPEDEADMVFVLKAYKFSDAFINIFVQLFRQRIPYVRFDRDARVMPELPVFEW